MKAGEAVYQGREGTGLAQVLNWKEYKSPTPKQTDPTKLLELQRKQKIDDDKFIEDASKFGKTNEWFSPTLTEDATTYKFALTDLINKGGVNPDQAKESLREKEMEIRKRIEIGNSAAQTYDELKKTDNKYIEKDKYESALREYLFPPRDEKYRITDWDGIDPETARNFINHPSIFKYEQYLTDLVNDQKASFEKGVIDDNLKQGYDGHLFFMKEREKTRFKPRLKEDGSVERYPNGVPKIDLNTIEHYANDNQFANSALWSSLAKEKGVDNKVILKAEREAIDQEVNWFLEYGKDPSKIIPGTADYEKYNQYKKKIFDKTEEILNGMNNYLDIKSVSSAGSRKSDFNLNIGSGAGKGVYSEPVEGEERPYLSYQDVFENPNNPNKMTSHDDYSNALELNALKNFTTDKFVNPITVTSVKTDKATGQLYLSLVEHEKGGDNVEQRLPWNKETKSILINRPKNKQEQYIFDKWLKDVENRKIEGTYADEEKFNSESQQLADIIKEESENNEFWSVSKFNLEHKTDEQLKKIQKWFDDKDIKVKVTKPASFKDTKIKVSGKFGEKEFFLQDDKEQLEKNIKSLLYEAKPSRYSKTNKKTEADKLGLN